MRLEAGSLDGKWTIHHALIASKKANLQEFVN